MERLVLKLLIGWMLTAIGLIVVPSPAAAQDETAEASEEAEIWRPPGVADDRLVWIRLKSGEWIRGTIDRMREETLEFDSEDLDDLKIDWEDVRGLYARSIHRYVLDTGETLTGSAVLENGVLEVQTKSGVIRAPASEVLAILEGEARERNRWSFDISLGISSMFGTSPQTSTSSSATFIREDDHTRLELSYRGAYGRSHGELTVNNHLGSMRFDWFASRYFFVNLAQGSIGHDNFRNIRMQATAGMGLGYTLIDSSRVDWSIDLSGAYVNISYVSVEPGSDDVDVGGAIIPASKLEIEITDDIDIGATSRNVLVVNNFDLSYFRTTGYLKIEINDTFDLNVNVSWDRDRSPVALDDGTVPEKDTILMVVGIGVSI